VVILLWVAVACAYLVVVAGLGQGLRMLRRAGRSSRPVRRPIVVPEETMEREREAGGVLATIAAWLGAAAMMILALIVLPFTGGARYPMSPRTPPVTITTPAAPITTPPTPAPANVASIVGVSPVGKQASPPSPAVVTTTPTTPPPAVEASRAILAPPAPAWPIVCGPVAIAQADGPLADVGTELELVKGPITVLTDVGTLEDAGVSLAGCA
jgi:hypothetical protein